MKWRKAGVFRTTESIANVDRVVQLIAKTKETRSKPVVADDTLGQACKDMSRFLIELGPERCGMTEEEHLRIIELYNTRQDALCGPEEVKRMMGLTGNPISDYEVKTKTIRDKYMRMREKYYRLDEHERSVIQEKEFMRLLILVVKIFAPDTRLNFATLKNGFHPDANPIKDNVLFATSTGVYIIWNVRKQDRQAGKNEEDTDIRREGYVYADAPFLEIADNPSFDPKWVGEEIFKYLKQPNKAKQEYVFMDGAATIALRKKDENGNDFINEKGHQEWDFKPVGTMILELTRAMFGEAIGTQRLRPAQIRRMHENLDLNNTDARLWLAEVNHHSAAENNLYNMVGKSVQSV